MKITEGNSESLVSDQKEAGRPNTENILGFFLLRVPGFLLFDLSLLAFLCGCDVTGDSPNVTGDSPGHSRAGMSSTEPALDPDRGIGGGNPEESAGKSSDIMQNL